MKKFLAVLLLVVAWSCPVSAAPTDYPRLAAYHGSSSWGPPFIKADLTLDSALIKQAARYPMITLNPNLCAGRTDLIPCFRYFNPNIVILFYDQMNNWHLDSTLVIAPTDQGFYAEKHRAIQWSHGWSGATNSGHNVSWKQQDVADTLIRLYVKRTKIDSPDGWFFDYCWPTLAWAGWSSEDDDYNSIFHVKRLITELRKAHPGILIYGNGPGNYGADRLPLDGGMNEGLLGSQTPFVTAIKQKEGDWLKSESAVGTSGNAVMARFTLGIACLTGAYAEHGNSHNYGAPEQGTWWFPEYSVAPDGTADAGGRYTSWLGAAVGPATKVTGTTWRRQFEHGAVVVNTLSTAQTIPFGGTYFAIGSTAPITSALCAGNSAVFVWK
jgi:hypothetical protein